MTKYNTLLTIFSPIFPPLQSGWDDSTESERPETEVGVSEPVSRQSYRRTSVSVSRESTVVRGKPKPTTPGYKSRCLMKNC